MVAIPTSIRVLGTYDQVRTFLGTVQTGLPRIFLVTGLDGSAQKAAEASAGRPATAAGDLELNITGYLWALPDTTAVDASAGGTTDGEAPAPMPQGSRNPCAPLG